MSWSRIVGRTRLDTPVISPAAGQVGAIGPAALAGAVEQEGAETADRSSSKKRSIQPAPHALQCRRNLAERGWTDAVLLEMNELTSGSTWHAAGNVPTFSGNRDILRLQKYSTELYARLATDPDYPIAYHQTGSIRLAQTRARLNGVSNGTANAGTGDVPSEEALDGTRLAEDGDVLPMAEAGYERGEWFEAVGEERLPADAAFTLEDIGELANRAFRRKGAESVDPLARCKETGSSLRLSINCK